MTEGTFRVTVDPDKCQGHNRCYSLAPDIFDVDDLGMASARGDGLIGADLVDKAKRAAANCPEYAITVTEMSATSGTSATSESEAAR